MQILFFCLLIFLNQPYTFRGTNSSILRSTFWLCIQLLVQCTGRQQCRCIVPKAVYTVKKCSWGWANLSPETCRADLKRLINEKVVASCWLFTSSTPDTFSLEQRECSCSLHIDWIGGDVCVFQDSMVWALFKGTLATNSTVCLTLKGPGDVLSRCTELRPFLSFHSTESKNWLLIDKVNTCTFFALRLTNATPDNPDLLVSAVGSPKLLSINTLSPGFLKWKDLCSISSPFSLL